MTYMRPCPQIQQRDCSGFAPDSLLGRSLRPAPQRIFNCVKIITYPRRAGKDKNAGITDAIPAELVKKACIGKHTLKFLLSQFADILGTALRAYFFVSTFITYTYYIMPYFSPLYLKRAAFW